MRKLLFLAFPALIGISWVSAFGQDYRTFRAELNEVSTQAKLRIGPLRFLPKLNLQNVGYDNNVYFRSPAQGPVGDYTGTISPEVKAYLLLGRSLILSFAENPEYFYFAHQTRLRSFTNSFAPAIRMNLFNRFTLSGEYHSQKHLRRASDEFLTPVTDTTKGSVASFFYETPRGSSIGVSLEIDRMAFEDIILPDYEVIYSKSLNRKETTGNIELYYPVFSDSAFFVKAGSTKYAFENPSARWRDASSVQASAGLRFPFTGRARGTLSIGYKKFVPNSEKRKTFSGLIADTSLDVRLGRIGLRFGLGRNNHFSYLEDAYYFVENRVSAGISFRLTRRFRLDYDFQRMGLDYPESVRINNPGLAPGEILRKDINRAQSVGLAIFFLRNTGIKLSYIAIRRDSNLPGTDRKRNFVGLSLTQDF